MIPFFQYTTILIGPIALQVWGVLVSLGIVLGLLVSLRLARRYFLSAEVVMDATVYGLIGGFVGARLAHVLFYNPWFYFVHPLNIFKIWEGGSSSLGGLLGMAAALIFFIRQRKLSWQFFLPYLDVSAVGLWLGWGVGRIGCFLIHDHPGTLSHFVLAVQFPAGARHDLGLYESLLALLLSVIAWVLLWQKKYLLPRGAVAAISFGLYGIVRFLLDFLRATDVSQSDVHYWLFTPMQWGILTIFFALTMWVIFGRVKRQKI